MNRGLKTAILLIATIITILCVLYGAMVHIGGFAAKSIIGYITGEEKIEFGEGFKDSKSSELSEDVRVIKLHVNAAEVDIKKGASNTITISSSMEKYGPEYKFEDGVLTVKQSDISSVGMPGKGLNNKVVITLSNKPEEISGVLELGDMDIEGITADSIDLVLNLGDMEIDDVTVTDITLVNKLGDIKVNGCDFKNAVMDNKLGDVKLNLTGNISDYRYKLGVDMGEIKIGSEKFGREYSTDSGDKMLKVNCNMGDIKITA